MFEQVYTQFRKFVHADDHSLMTHSVDTMYSYFQDRFGNTHYNILVGKVGSGKNYVLLTFGELGYRPFYVTSASPANYFTFLWENQEG